MSRRLSAPQFLATPAIRADIAAALERRGVDSSDLRDLVQETLARALAVRNPPRDFAQCLLLTRVIARNVAIDHLRRAMVRRRYATASATDDPRAPFDPVAAIRDPVDRRRQLTMLMGEVDRGALSRRAIAIVHAVSENVPQAEIAAELGIRHQTVRNELWLARRLFRAKWGAREASTE